MRTAELALHEIERAVPACERCPRLAGFLRELRERQPDYWNRPVPGFGDPSAWLVIVGLAPGMHGANRSGQPFFMDASGEWLYGELGRRGWYDGERLEGVYILNAVKCLPPQNKPTPAEQTSCRPWLAQELEVLPSARVLLALGRIAWDAVLRCLELAPARHPFAHGALVPRERGPQLLASYHPSRQNTNTGVLTRAMWRATFARAARLGAARTAPTERSAASRPPQFGVGPRRSRAE
jgi:uracil-DNA glycosylase family 4